MTREEAKASIAIMQAYVDGKTLQTNYNGEWMDADCPSFDWLRNDYRIKPEPTYRPFKDGKELVAEYCKRFGVERKAGIEPSIWVLNEYYEDVHRRSMISDIDDDGVWFAGEARTVTCYSDFLDNYAFLDGSPCGVEEEDFVPKTEEAEQC